MAAPRPAGPGHVAIIMDGNGRWARRRHLPRALGHRRGIANLRAVVELAKERAISVLTCYAFSSENWRRPRQEVRALLAMMQETIERELADFHRQGLRLRFIGRWRDLPEPLPEMLKRAEQVTAANQGMVLCLAVNYGGRQEIVDALRRAAAAGGDLQALDEATVAAHLDTAGLPDPDLIIRTAGELRLSNFLIWQGAYAEYWSTPTLWPDFGSAELDAALGAYAGRSRKFGAVEPAARP